MNRHTLRFQGVLLAARDRGWKGGDVKLLLAGSRSTGGGGGRPSRGGREGGVRR